MTSRKTQQESIPPILSPSQAIAFLRRQSQRANAIAAMRFDDPQIDVWLNSTENILNQSFGKPGGERHENTLAFMRADCSVPHFNPSDSEIQQEHTLTTEKRKALLEGFVEQLEDLAPPSARTAPDRYIFHSEIERVSGDLYRSGHYKSAALEGYIRVIAQVKAVSRIPDDGDSLMNKAFACDRQTPVVQFNGLGSEAEQDEQRAIFLLFKGVVGLRNAKAHDNRLFDDPLRGHDYLALASLLMRLLEIAQINPVQ